MKVDWPSSQFVFVVLRAEQNIVIPMIEKFEKILIKIVNLGIFQKKLTGSRLFDFLKGILVFDLNFVDQLFVEDQAFIFLLVSSELFKLLAQRASLLRHPSFFICRITKIGESPKYLISFTASYCSQTTESERVCFNSM